MHPTDLTKDQKIARQASELDAEKRRQIAVLTGEKEENFVTANRNSKHRVRALEAEGYVHVHTIIKHLDQGGKSFTNEERTIKFHARGFDNLVKDGVFKTYDEVEVIHDPRKGFENRVYSLKPDQLNVDGPASRTDEAKVNKELDKRRQRLDEDAQKMNTLADNLGKRMDDLEKREQAFQDREKAILDRETKLEEQEKAAAAKKPEQPIAPAAPAGPVTLTIDSNTAPAAGSTETAKTSEAPKGDGAIAPGPKTK